MKILGFDTATRATTVALLDTDSDEAVERRDDPPAGERPRHTTHLMRLVVEVLGASRTDWGGVDRIAVGIGPGTFTGLRIGVATAHALARARAIPLVGVSTLHALARGAEGARAAPSDAIMAVIDARRGEVFAAGWGIVEVMRPDGEPLLTPRAMAPDALSEIMTGDGRGWLAVGDGTVEFGQALARSGARIPEPDSQLHRVSSVQHCRLASGLRPELPEAVQPEYLRLPDAEITLRASRQK